MDSTRYRIMIDNPIDNSHAGIPMSTRTGLTFGSASGPLVAAVLVRERDADTGGERWRVVLASHTRSAAHDLMSAMFMGGRRAVVVPMIKIPTPGRAARGTPAPNASGNERRLDVQRAGELAAAGRVAEARKLLAKHDLHYIAVEVIADPDGVGKVRQ